MTIYHTQLGTLALPAGLTDRTLHLLVARGDGPGFNIAISHSPLQPNEDLDAYVKREISDLKRQVTKLEVTQQTPTKLGSSDIDGYCIELQYRQKGVLLYHRQGVFALPQSGQTITIVASSTAPFTPAQRTVFDDLIASFKPYQTH